MFSSFCFSLVVYNGNMSALDNLHSDDFNGIFMVSQEIFEYYNFLNNESQRIICQKETIRMMLFSIYLPKHSCITDVVNLVIHRLTSSGLIPFWTAQFRKSNARRKHDKREPKRLAIDQINGLITICTIFYIICVMCFIFELMSIRHASIKMIMDFFSSDKTKN